MNQVQPMTSVHDHFAVWKPYLPWVPLLLLHDINIFASPNAPFPLPSHRTPWHSKIFSRVAWIALDCFGLLFEPLHTQVCRYTKNILYGKMQKHTHWHVSYRMYLCRNVYEFERTCNCKLVDFANWPNLLWSRVEIIVDNQANKTYQCIDTSMSMSIHYQTHTISTTDCKQIQPRCQPSAAVLSAQGLVFLSRGIIMPVNTTSTRERNRSKHNGCCFW